MINFSLLGATSPVYDLFTFGWWAVVAVIVFALTYFLPKIIKTREARLTTIKTFAIIGLLSHLSIFFVFYFRNGAVDAGAAIDAMFAIAPCNAMTWLAVLAFLFRHDSKPQKIIFILAGYGTLIFGLISVLYPEFYHGLGTQGMAFWADYGFWKSVIFHSIMVMTGSLFFAFKIITPRVKHGLVMLVGLFVGLYTYGYGLTLISEYYGVDRSFFYFRDFPLKDMFSVQTAILMVAFVVATIGLIVEKTTLPKEERTTTIIYNKIKNLKLLNKPNLEEKDQEEKEA